jgi:hypothetical protein
MHEGDSALQRGHARAVKRGHAAKPRGHTVRQAAPSCLRNRLVCALYGRVRPEERGMGHVRIASYVTCEAGDPASHGGWSRDDLSCRAEEEANGVSKPIGDMRNAMRRSGRPAAVEITLLVCQVP